MRESNYIDNVSYIEEVVNVLVPDAIAFEAVHKNAIDGSNRPIAGRHTAFVGTQF